MLLDRTKKLNGAAESLRLTPREPIEQSEQETMKNTLASLCLAMIVLLPSPGCGTLMFSQRQDQSHSDRLDPNILILDGLGLLLFVIPGLVAYGVDFHTGAVYLPDGVEKGEGPFIRDPDEREEDTE